MKFQGTFEKNSKKENDYKTDKIFKFHFCTQAKFYNTSSDPKKKLHFSFKIYNVTIRPLNWTKFSD